MDLFIFAIGYFALTAFFIFILLFGESPVFKGTPVAAVHWFVTSGLCNGSEWLIARLCGARGSQALDACYMSCCERPNPALQAAYLAMVLGGFYIYWTNLFVLLPNPWADEGHILFGSASVVTSLLLFVWASASDPGTVRPHDAAHLAAWHRLYPLDGIIFPAKGCLTCGLDRPARSKHCRVCNRCVARHDHHCQWINNCVGFLNLRVFLAFLVANLAMCAYGTVLAWLILGGEMDRRDMFHTRIVNYRTGKVVPLVRAPGKMVEWLVVFYPLGVAMGLFMLVATLLMAAFLSYQIYLLAIGRTQYEVFKWREVHFTLLELAEAEAAEEQQRKEQQQQQQRAGTVGPEGGGQSNRRPQGGKERAGGRGLWVWLRGEGSRRRRVTVKLPPNIYHRGFWANLAEVLLPEVHFRRALEAVTTQGGTAPGAAAPLGDGASRGMARVGGTAGGGGVKGNGGREGGGGGSGSRGKKVQ